MPDLALHFDIDPDTSDAAAGQLAQQLRARLERLTNVEAVETSTPRSRVTGLEILAAITIAAQIVHHAKEISDDLHAIVGNLRSTFQDISRLAKELTSRDVFIPVKGRRKSISELSDDDYRAIVERMLRPPVS